jgi:DNA polymerase III subunit delta'
MPAAVAWPDALTGTPAVAVIERALAEHRLAHSLLITGDQMETIEAVAAAIADRLLNPPDAPDPFPLERHPDCLHLRPRGKARIIAIGDAANPAAGTMRDFLPKLYVSPAVSRHKVGIVHEADTLRQESANAFLKTLEEPPPHTTLLLLTTRPYALLPTIRSRCLTFRFPAATAGFAPTGWEAWQRDYRAWIETLIAGVADRAAAADALFAAYGLVTRFTVILDAATAEAWEARKGELPEDLSDEEKIALETGLAQGLRLQLLAGVEHATRDAALPRVLAGEAEVARALPPAVAALEHAVGLLRLNLKAEAALEHFFLTSLRLWARR